MAYVACPNCGITLVSALTVEPPTTCPDCCARLSRDGALSSPPRTRQADVSPTFDAVLASGRDAPRTAREAFASFVEPFGEDLARTGALLVSEVVTNAVLHGPATESPTVGLHFATAGDRLQIEVSDDGPGFEPAAWHPADDAESGWGLHLVAAMATSWGVDSGRPTRVWFELPLARRAD